MKHNFPVRFLSKRQAVRKLTCSFLLILLPACILRAQDTLYKSTGAIQVVKILEINAQQVKYKNSENMDGPTYVIGKEWVQKIIYANGESEQFPVNPIDSGRFFVHSTNFSRRFISINLIDLFARSLTINVERILPSGNFSLRFPCSLGFTTLGLTEDEITYDSKNSYFNRNKIFSLGMDLFFYSFGQGKSKFFIGPSIEYGQFNYYRNNLSYYPVYSFEIIKSTGSFYSLLLMTGCLFQPYRHMNFSFNLGIGYSSFTAAEGNQSSLTVHSTDEGIIFRLGMNLGYTL